MVNQARRGARAENAVGDLLGEYGYDVIRSAASKGAADLVAVGNRQILFVQVKLGVHGERFKIPSPAERRELIRIAQRAGPRGLAVTVCRFPGSGPRSAETVWRVLTGAGPLEWETWSPQVQEDVRT